MIKTALQIFNYQMVNQADGSVDIHIDGDIVDSPTQEIYRNFWGDETSVSFKSFEFLVLNIFSAPVERIIMNGNGT